MLLYLLTVVEIVLVSDLTLNTSSATIFTSMVPADIKEGSDFASPAKGGIKMDKKVFLLGKTKVQIN